MKKPILEHEKYRWANRSGRVSKLSTFEHTVFEFLSSYLCFFASGLAQCTELCLQLRGLAGDRQVPSAKLGLQHNLGLGGAVVVALYKMGFESDNK